MRKKLINFFVIFLFLGFGSILFGQNVVYISSNTGEPWGKQGNINALNDVFGAGNWTHEYYQTLDMASILGTYKIIILEGGNDAYSLLQSLLDSSHTDIEDWVMRGNVLLINAAPNGVLTMNFYFSGVGLDRTNVYNTGYSVGSHLIFDGPLTPVGNTWNGNSFAHGFLTGTFTDIIIDDGAGHPLLAEKEWGAGIVLFGSLTTSWIGEDTNWTPSPDIENLHRNIYSYLDYTSNNIKRWTGATDTDWFTASNWEDNAVPTIDSKVLIPSIPSGNPDNFPVISGANAYCRVIIIDSLASITILPSDTLNVALSLKNYSQNYTGNGEIVIGNNDSFVVFLSGKITNITIDNDTVSMSVDTVDISNTLTLQSKYLVKKECLILNNPIVGFDTNLLATKDASLVINGDGINIPSSVTELFDLTVNNLDGISLQSDLSIYNNLNLQNGDLSIGSNLLSLYGNYNQGNGILLGDSTSDLYIGNNLNYIPDGNKANKIIDYKVVYPEELSEKQQDEKIISLTNSTGTGTSLREIPIYAPKSSSPQFVLPEITLHDLTVERDSGLVLSGNLYLSGDLIVEYGQFSTNKYDIEIEGDLVNRYKFKQTTGNLIFVGDSVSNIELEAARRTIYFEDFESVGPILQFTDSQSNINGLNGWSYEDADGLGKLTFDYGINHSGSYAAGIASETDGNYTTNYLILTEDVSAYSDILLSFWFYNSWDEDDAQDRVWIRGSYTDPWIEIYDWTGTTSNTWIKVENINIDSILASEGQSATATFQIRFGQYDNYTLGSDGLIIDDVQITAFVNTNNDFNYITINKDSAAVNILQDIYINNEFTLSNGFLTANADTIKLHYNSGATLCYAGNMQQTTDSLVFPVADAPTNLSILDTAGVFLHTDRTIEGILNLEGKFYLSGNNFTLGDTASVTGVFGDNAMVVANDTSEFRKFFTSDTTFLFPVGENGYAPASITLTNGTYSANSYVAVSCNNQKHSLNADTVNYLNRYWTLSQSDISDDTCLITLVYADNDVVGSDTYMLGVHRSDSTWEVININPDNNTISATLTELGDFTAKSKDLKDITVTVYDFHGDELAGADVLFDVLTETTDTNGVAYFSVPLDTYLYTVNPNVDCNDNFSDTVTIDSSINNIDVYLSVFDTINPVIVCLENQEVTIDSGSVYTIVGTEFDPTDVNDNCEILSVTNNLNDTSTLAGVELPIGTTTVTWTITDAANNQSECSFDILVTDGNGISDMQENIIAVYPNPTNAIVNIDFKNENIRYFSITDITGKILIEKTNVQPAETIDLSGLANGVYLLKIQTDKKVFTNKIIKE